MAKRASKNGSGDKSDPPPDDGKGKGEGETKAPRNLDLGIRFVDPALGEALKAAAKKDKRSVNSLVNIMLEKALAELGMWPWKSGGADE